MSTDNTLKAQARDRVGKGASRELRRNKLVPAVIYGDKQDPLLVTFGYQDLMKHVQTGRLMSTLVDIDVDGDKTRAIAREAVKGGKVRIDGHRVKAGRSLKEGDRLNIRRGEEEYLVTVQDLGDRRVSATLAQEKFTEDPDSKARREAAAEKRHLDYKAKANHQRRPDKRQRRQIIRFTRDE